MNDKGKKPVIKTTKDDNSEGKNIKNKEIKRKRINSLIIAIAFISAIVIIFFILLQSGINSNYNDKYNDNNPNKKHDIAQILQNKTPELIFKKIEFNKYVVLVKNDGTTQNAIALYAKGNALIKFNIKNITFKKKGNNGYYAIIHDKNIKDIFSIDVNIFPQDVKTVYSSTKNLKTKSKTTVNNKEGFLKRYGKYIKPVGTILGSLAGFTVSGGLVGLITNPIAVISSTALGGFGGYLLTDHFISKMNADHINIDKNSVNNSISFGENEEVMSNLRKTIALELLSAQSGTFKKDDEIIKYYKKSLKDALTNIFNTAGATVTVEF